MDVAPQVTDAVSRLKAVFLEMPRTRLTPADASRLSGLEQPLCEFVLLALEDAGFLRRGADGLYRRRMSDSPQV